jgi:A/G-specific adenine glycosylase
MDDSDFTSPLLDWYRRTARVLPWRQPDASPWAILVSEIMLAQTPVARVLPAYVAWLARWPDPQSLAAKPAAEAVRMWGKLGYPRRALRLHACARALVDDYGGQVPTDVAALIELPGVGAYTARAVAAFAFGQRVAVVDTNVRRVHARLVLGHGAAAPPSTTRDLAAVEALLPADPATAARLSVALMEFGALVCTARAPKCENCALSPHCEWLRAGRPAYTGPAVKPQRFTGTDRQVRGKLLDVLRASPDPVARASLDVAWPEPVQRERALTSLVSDGLITQLPGAHYALPGS